MHIISELSKSVHACQTAASHSWFVSLRHSTKILSQWRQAGVSFLSQIPVYTEFSCTRSSEQNPHNSSGCSIHFMRGTISIVMQSAHLP